jgi:hypothetical protein
LGFRKPTNGVQMEVALPVAMASKKAALVGYTVGPPLLHSVCVQPSLVLAATLQLSVMSVAGAVYLLT